MSYQRLLNFAKIVNDEFSDIVLDVDLYPDKLKITLIDGSWIEVRYTVMGKFSFHSQREVTKSIELIQLHITGT